MNIQGLYFGKWPGEKGASPDAFECDWDVDLAFPDFLALRASIHTYLRRTVEEERARSPNCPIQALGHTSFRIWRESLDEVPFALPGRRS